MSTNTSESINNILSEAREVSCVEVINPILTKIILRPVLLQIICKNDRGLIQEWNLKMNDCWENCLGFYLHQIDDNCCMSNQAYERIKC